LIQLNALNIAPKLFN